MFSEQIDSAIWFLLYDLWIFSMKHRLKWDKIKTICSSVFLILTIYVPLSTLVLEMRVSWWLQMLKWTKEIHLGQGNQRPIMCIIFVCPLQNLYVVITI